jgi:two-component system chemotaxis response regulator CheY
MGNIGAKAMNEYHQVLIVDDSETSRMIIQRCLEMAGIRSATFYHAENGLDALAQLKDSQDRKEPMELIVTDLNMPKMDGRAFVRIVKGTPQFSKVTLIVVSSIADGDAEAELRSLGAAAVVKKPLSPAKLVSVLGGDL